MFIQDMLCISPQNTFGESFFENGITVFENDKYLANEPAYGDLIPLNQLRRMSKSIRMSMGTGYSLIKKHTNIEAVLVGSSIGSVESALKFLLQIVEYNEGTLTPTHFVQSTSNAIAGVLAQLGNITGYNNTHVTAGISFETALLDALLLFDEKRTKKILLGGVEEYSEAYYNINLSRGIWKEQAVNSNKLLTSNTKGTVCGEGSTFFVMEAEKNKESIAEIVDVSVFSFLSKGEVSDYTRHFLTQNNITPEEIDCVILGRNGDLDSDTYYTHIEQELFPTKMVVVYKHLMGDFSTVSSTATWIGAKLLSGSTLPAEMVWTKRTGRPNLVLLYNHEEGKQHGLILMKSCS